MLFLGEEVTAPALSLAGAPAAAGGREAVREAGPGWAVAVLLPGEPVW